MVGERTCKRCREPLEQWRGQTLCRDCRRTVVLRDLPCDENVLASLTHFRRPVTIADGEAVVEVGGGLRLHFEILEEPDVTGFWRYPRWVRYDHAEVAT